MKKKAREEQPDIDDDAARELAYQRESSGEPSTPEEGTGGAA